MGVVGLLLTLPLAARAQSGAIRGEVTQAATGAPLLGATITLAGAGRGALADSLGRFSITGLAGGSYSVRARRQGFREAERLVTVRAGETTTVSFALVAEPQSLGAVRTEATTPDRELFLSRAALSTTSLSARAMEAMPRLGEADIMRIVQLMPGVAAKNDFTTGFNVHGGEADQNLVLLDGYPIYNPFHVGGLFSTFMEATVRDATLRSGAFPARYGGRLSSILDVRSAVEERSGLHGSAEVSLVGLTATFGSRHGDRGSWMIAARRTYADWIAGRFTDNVLPYHFRDVQGHATLSLPGEWTLSLTGYGGDDQLDADLSELQADSADAAGGGSVLFRWGNAVAGATLRRAVSGVPWADSVVLAQRFSRTRFSTDVNLADGAATLRNTIHDVRLGGDATAFSDAHTVAMGYEISRFRTLVVDGSPQAGVRGTNQRQRGMALAAFVDDTWHPGSGLRWIVESGLRLERVPDARWTGLSPRLGAKFFVHDNLALTVGVGRTTQWMHSLAVEENPIRFFDSYLASDSATPVASADHFVAGVERWLGASRQIRVEAFVKRYARLPESDLAQDPFVAGDEFLPSSGRSYGVDVFLRQFEGPGSRLSGWLSWNYAVASREQNGVRFAPGHDRRHNVNAVATLRAGKYVVGARLGLATGTPYTPIVGEYVRRRFDPITGTWENPGQPPYDVDYIGGTRNGARYPLTHRLDLSLSREYVRGRTIIRPYLSVVNAYNARNVFAYVVEYGNVPPTQRTISQFPILPSAGVHVAW